MSSSRKAMLLTAIPIIVICLIAIIISLAYPHGPNDGIGYGIAGLVGISIIAAIVFTVKHNKQVAKGIWSGIGVSLIIFIISFFIMSVFEGC